MASQQNCHPERSEAETKDLRLFLILPLFFLPGCIDMELPGANAHYW
jgi:hypothetical protein